MENLLPILKRHWGYDTLRPLQHEIMTAILEGRDSLAILPTGGGKSLCFQAPALTMEGAALVISPLIALMKDQVESLAACGIEAAFINSSQGPDERREVARKLQTGEVKLLYVSPERLTSSAFIEYLANTVKLSFLAVDEAHCISMWGHDFRPEYREIHRLREAFPSLHVHACTATATPHVRKDIIHGLSLRDPDVLVGSFDRPNLIYKVKLASNRLAQVKEIIARHQGESGIIYCISRAEVDSTAEILQDMGLRALPYHAGLDAATRKRNQDAFIKDQAGIIVATVAFGMGIDKPNVRYVIHAGMPKSIEHYQQESGRGGRDGLEAECVLLYAPRDFMTWKRILQQNNEGTDEATRAALRKLDEVFNFCRNDKCRHRALTAYFGEIGGKPDCGACDVCLEDVELVPNALQTAQKILSAVARTGEQFGGAYVADSLLGKDSDRARQLGHDKLSTWGLLKAHSGEDVRDWIEQLTSQGILTRENAYGSLRLTSAGKEVLRGAHTPRLIRRIAVQPSRSTSRRADSTDWQGVDKGLFEHLRQVRSDQATKQNVSAHVIFGDITLRALARHRPSNEAGFLMVHGVGLKKCRIYGGVFLAAIRSYCDENELAQDIGLDTISATGSMYGPDESNPSTRKRMRAEEAAFTLFADGLSLDEVAEAVGRSRSWTIERLALFITNNGRKSPEPWVEADIFEKVSAVAASTGLETLRPIFEALNEEIPYDVIRVCVACLKRGE